MPSETIDTYDFDEDALGLGPFITKNIGNLPTEEIVVYVEDEQGRSAQSAAFVRQTLTDGSTVVNLVIRFN